MKTIEKYLIEKNLILQEKIIRGFINICKEKEKEKKWYENFDKEELEEYEARLNILIILQQLFEDFSIPDSVKSINCSWEIGLYEFVSCGKGVDNNNSFV